MADDVGVLGANGASVSFIIKISLSEPEFPAASNPPTKSVNVSNNVKPLNPVKSPNVVTPEVQAILVLKLLIAQ